MDSTTAAQASLPSLDTRTPDTPASGVSIAQTSRGSSAQGSPSTTVPSFHRFVTEFLSKPAKLRIPAHSLQSFTSRNLRHNGPPTPPIPPKYGRGSTASGQMQWHTPHGPKANVGAATTASASTQTSHYFERGTPTNDSVLTEARCKFGHVLCVCMQLGLAPCVLAH